MNKKTTLVLAIAGILGSQVAIAGTINLTTDGNSADVVTYAQEMPTPTHTSGENFGFAHNLQIAPPDRIEITDSNPAYLQFDLLGGAKFKSTAGMKLVCEFSGDASNSASNITVGGADNSQVIFQLPNGVVSAPNTTSGCYLKGVTGLSLSGFGAKSVSAQFSYYLAGVPDAKNYKASLITFGRALDATFDATPPKNMIDVGQAGKLFTGAVGASTASKRVIVLGTVGFSGVVNAGEKRAAGVLTQASAVDSYDIQIAGKVVDAVAAKYTSSIGVYLVSGTNNCTATTAGFASDVTVATTKPKAGVYEASKVTFKAVPASEFVGNKLTVCLTVDGSTPMEKGQITASLIPNAKTGWNVSASNSGKLTLIQKNGVSKKVLLLPKPNAGAGDTVNVRLYNTGTIEGKVLGTLYYDDPLVAGTVYDAKTGVLVDALAANAVVVMNQAAIATALGVDTWVGRAWLQIDAEFKGLEVQALMRAPNGQNIDVSAGVCQETVTPGTDAILCGAMPE